MFAVKNGLEYKYDFTEKKFQLAFDFLKRKDLAELEPQSIELGEGVRANILHYDSKAWETVKFESHERFFDIQYIVEGVEYFGVCEREGLKVAIPYNPVKDVTFYEDPELYGKVLLKADDYIIVGPEDVHKPSCAAGKSIPIKKVVLKVPV